MELIRFKLKWNFKILYTGIKWQDAIKYEYTGHGSSPKNLVPISKNYSGNWVCNICQNETYDSGAWKCASESALKYMQSNMKINGLKGKLGNTIKINLTDKKDKNKNSLVFSVDTTIQFSKRYIRYLVKKFLKREGIARFLTVSSTAPNAYTVKVIKKNEA